VKATHTSWCDDCIHMRLRAIPPGMDEHEAICQSPALPSSSKLLVLDEWWSGDLNRPSHFVRTRRCMNEGMKEVP